MSAAFLSSLLTRKTGFETGLKKKQAGLRRKPGRLIGAGPVSQRGISQPDDVIVRERVDWEEDVEKDSAS